MKNFLLFTFLMLFGVASFSQTFFTSKEYGVCLYNSSTQEYDICDIFESNSLFKVSADESSISFTTPDEVSVYYVIERSVDQAKSQYWYLVRYNSEVEHIIVIDLLNKEIRVLVSDSENNAILYYIIDDYWTGN